MAEVTGWSADKIAEAIGETVIDMNVSSTGVVRMVKVNGSEQVVGALNEAIENQVSDSLRVEMQSKVQNMGSFGPGAIDLSSKTPTEMVNRMILLTATGSLTFSTSNLPASVLPGTQFSIRFKQDATGGRTLTLTGFKVSYGSFSVTTTPNAVDVIVFFYDGDGWYAGLMGANFS